MRQISFQLHLPKTFYGRVALSDPLALERPKRPSINGVKNCAPFTKCISRINNKDIDNAQDIDIVMPMYNLI